MKVDVYKELAIDLLAATSYLNMMQATQIVDYLRNSGLLTDYYELKEYYEQED